jgi:hypothetical protein
MGVVVIIRSENLEERGLLEDLCVKGRIKLK